ncbi:discoidin domain-containing protein [Nocardia brasiliensis]|uniref:discoidin domain-containing protein n=1 Tax=Nocardia brasiliensis TaxID=37326 RepID=UPI002453C072|nr:hypothetical protein [Nocardia brasiliensis]
MLDDEPTDLFLRHRAAVLATLFGGQDVKDRAPDDLSESGSPDAQSSEAQSSISPIPETRPGSRGGVDGGPTASQQINALLSGHPSARPAAMDPLPAPTARDELDEPRSPQQRPTPQRRRAALPPADQLARSALRQLRKPIVPLAAVAALALVIVLVLVSGGGQDEPTPSLVTAAPNADPAQASNSATQAPPAGGNIRVAAAEATCPPGGTPGMDAFDGRPATAWSCTRAFDVDGQVLRIDLGGSYTIDSIGLVPGWDHVTVDNADQWSRYRTVSRVSYRLNDERATTFTQPTLDQRTLVTTKIDPPLRASQVVLTVLQSSGRPTADTTAISTIVIHGH